MLSQLSELVLLAMSGFLIVTMTIALVTGIVYLLDELARGGKR